MKDIKNHKLMKFITKNISVKNDLRPFLYAVPIYLGNKSKKLSSFSKAKNLQRTRSGTEEDPPHN